MISTSDLRLRVQELELENKRLKMISERTNAVRSRKRARTKVPAALRNLVWEKYVDDKNNAFCYCCRYEVISYGNFECGHIISVKKNGPTNIHNLRPICSLCNKSMGIRNMFEFIHAYGFHDDVKCDAGDQEVLIESSYFKGGPVMGQRHSKFSSSTFLKTSKQ